MLFALALLDIRCRCGIIAAQAGRLWQCLAKAALPELRRTAATSVQLVDYPQFLGARRGGKAYIDFQI
jgi:hypothetical protein